jgi:hypothetical protein
VTTYTINGTVTGIGLVTSQCGYQDTQVATLSCDVTGNLLMFNGSGTGFIPPRFLILSGGPPKWTATFNNGSGNPGEPNAMVTVNATDPEHPFLFFQNVGSINGFTAPFLNPSGRGFPDGAALAPGCWSTAFPNGFFHFVD